MTLCGTACHSCRRRHVFVLNFLWAFKSITMTVMLSLLPFWRARFERYSAAACAAGSIPAPLSDGGVTPFFLCQSRIRLRARSHTSSFVITSHKPSLARMRHSSSFARGRNITSGSGMIHGFKYLSPANQMDGRCTSKSWFQQAQYNYEPNLMASTVIFILKETTKAIIRPFTSEFTVSPFCRVFQVKLKQHPPSFPHSTSSNWSDGDWPPYQWKMIATIK